MSVPSLKTTAPDAPAGLPPRAGGARLPEHLLLLAYDESLIEALVSVVPAASLTLVSDEAELATFLMGGQHGVVFIDSGAPRVQPGATARLAQRLHNELPDVVLVVAGDGAAQSEVAALVADGTIYRFVHKPVSAQRVKLFIDAAWRKREGASASGIYPALSLPQTPPAAVIETPRTFPWTAILGALVLIGIAAAWLLLRSSSTGSADAPAHPPAAQGMPSVPLPHAAAASQAAAPAVATTTISATAADLDRLATAAEQALLAGNLAEATRLTDAARAVDPNHVRVKFLSAQIAREQARQTARRRQADQEAAQASASYLPPPATAPPSTPFQVSLPPRIQEPTLPAASAPAPASSSTSAPAAATPVVASSPTTATETSAASAAPASGPPSSTPPVSEARDRNSVAAVILQRVYSVDPVFPELARERDLRGFVDLEFTVRADGSVTDITVLKSVPSGVFEKSAVDAVSQWRYRPIERNGVPVNEHARLRLNFAYK